MTSALKNKRKNSRGQSSVEYVLVISVLSIAIYYATNAFCVGFTEGMDILTGSLASSLTSDGIRP